MIKRISTKTIKLNNLIIGGASPVSIQSMTNTNSEDFTATKKQVIKLIDAGAELVRVSTPTLSSVDVLSKIQNIVSIPLCADIHFDYTIALKSIEKGIPKIRINPGTLGTHDQYIEVLKQAKKHNTVIRIGVNSGSIHTSYIHLPLVQALYKSIAQYVSTAETHSFNSIILSAKTTSVQDTIEINKKLSGSFKYPLHIGVTEAGTCEQSYAKSFSALGYLLLNGIGDTVRISISGDPIQEVLAARRLLGALDMRKEPSVVSCPTCGRTQVKNLESFARTIESLLFTYNKPITCSVMGCSVNGPGECTKSNIGILLNADSFVLYINGKKVKLYPLSKFNSIVEKEIKHYSL